MKYVGLLITAIGGFIIGDAIENMNHITGVIGIFVLTFGNTTYNIERMKENA